MRPLYFSNSTYRFTRRNASDIDKFFNFFAQLNIAAAGNTLSLGSGSELQSYREVGPNLFRLEGGSDLIGGRDEPFRIETARGLGYRLIPEP